MAMWKRSSREIKENIDEATDPQAEGGASLRTWTRSRSSGRTGPHHMNFLTSKILTSCEWEVPLRQLVGAISSARRSGSLDIDIIDLFRVVLMDYRSGLFRQRTDSTLSKSFLVRWLCQGPRPVF